ncbi:sugar ABC transporter permease [Actinacidiphila acididurans]|uniref:Xylose transport system permease protein XylH n=1 Tax=Actinacidiphila acididurans TaxID=2784346 RepID=A0ABS2TJ71_9ACTN|nr:sugar ABC transporter permease [Actinacidiphila acididurans]MBM9503385.1 sugar ABC transporter permease [Actinacidiphila acididurans]
MAVSGPGTPGTVRSTGPPAGGPVPAGARRIKAYADVVWRRLRPGERSALPVVLGLVVVWAVFQSQNGNFLSPRNLSNISVDLVSTGMIAAGLIFVLVIGEIDLSVGSLSGLAGAVYAALNVSHGVPEWLAVLLALASGAAAGALQGFFVARARVPSYAITLAGLLAWNGLMLYLLSPTGTIDINDNGFVASLTDHYFSDVWVAYGLATLGTAGYVLTAHLRVRRRKAAGVPHQPLTEIWVRAALLAGLAFTAAWMLNRFQGVPLALLIFLIVVAGLDYVLRRTSYGRMVIALGGKGEGARRAGIDVLRVRVSVFMMSGTLAAVGGLFMTSRLVSASQATGSDGQVLINAVAAAVLGGTSLFGGRGTIWSALFGVLVIESIASGMALLGAGQPLQFVITGGVLFVAVVIDSLLHHPPARNRA